VIDTITVLQELAEQYMLENIKTERGDAAKNILSYGYNKGYRHLFDTMKLILVDLDAHVKRGVNVLLIAQSIPARIPNPGGIDFMREGPNLSTNSQGNIRALYREWADHVLRIGYTNAFVEKPDKKVRSSVRPSGVFSSSLSYGSRPNPARYASPWCRFLSPGIA